jgi:hypothetical protein
MLSEIGVGAASAAQASVPAEADCSAKAWELNDPEPGETSLQLACRALVVGILLPPFGGGGGFFPDAVSPAKWAWLATAYVEAEKGAQTSATLQAIRNLALRQLELDRNPRSLADLADSPDPVVAPLARIFAAQQLKMPLRSEHEARARYLMERTGGMPVFTRAVYLERASTFDPFHQVDICVLGHLFPAMLFRTECRSEDTEEWHEKTRKPSQAEAALYQEWRIAAFYQKLIYNVYTLGLRDGMTKALDAMPPDVLSHPIVQHRRFSLDKFDQAEGSFDAYLNRVRSSVTSFVQATADLQFYDSILGGYSLTEHVWISNASVLSDKVIQEVTDEEARLISVLKFDRFNSPDPEHFPASRRHAGEPAPFLSPGAFHAAQFQAQTLAATRQGPLGPPPFAVTEVAPTWTSFWTHDPGFKRPTRSELQANVAAYPAYMQPRVALAIFDLKEGAPLTEARAVIDGYVKDDRTDRQVAESNEWDSAASALFFAGEEEAAAAYYQQVRELDTGSEADLRSSIRLHQIAGEIPAARDAAEVRLRRYESDFARRDLAGLLLMTNKTEQAWATIRPRLAVTDRFEVWMAAFAAHRLSGLRLAEIQDWIISNKLERASVNYQHAGNMYLHLYAVVDRIPTDDEIRLLQEAGTDSPGRSEVWAASARLVRMALGSSNRAEEFKRVRASVLRYASGSRFMLPLYTWVVWNATEGKDAELDQVRAATTEWEFDWLVSKSMILALEGNIRESRNYLRAARYELATLSSRPGYGPDRLDERPIPAPYAYALAVYLMHLKTGDEAYRVEASQFARAYQKVFPYWAWTYSMDALMERDATARAIASCRAKYLDAQSMFLRLSGEAPDLNSPACKKSLW